MKQVLVIDAALRLPKGKLAAQAAHGSVAAFLEAGPIARADWLAEGMPKVVLAASGTEELLRLEAEAAAAGLPYCLIRDAGRTVLEEGTVTCLGIGPAEDAAVDRITGELKLL